MTLGRIFAVVAVAAMPLLTGCNQLILASGAAVGTLAIEDRTFGDAITDAEIRVRINALWSDSDERLWRKIGLQVHTSRVLLTGLADTAEMRDKAVSLTWKARGVKEVINEIQVDPDPNPMEFVSDRLISSTLKLRLLADAKVKSVNYSVETVARTIYLLGVAQSEEERARVINHGGNINSVRRVISHILVRKSEYEVS